MKGKARKRELSLLLAFSFLLHSGCGGRTVLQGGSRGAGFDAGADALVDSDAFSVEDGRVVEAAVPIVLGARRVTPVCLGLTATDVYWCDYGTGAGDGMLMTEPIGGGTLRALVGNDDPWSLAIKDDTVYWASFGSSGSDGTIKSVPLAGGAPNTLAAGRSGPWSVVVDDTHVYWTERMNGSVTSAPRTKVPGQAPLTLAQSLDSPTELALFDGTLYWTSYMADEGIFTVPAAGGARYTELVANQDYPDSLVVDAQTIYFGTREGVMRMPRGGGTATLLAPAAQRVVGVASDGINVYWTDYYANTVSRVSVNGGAVTTIATGQMGAYAIAVDDKNVYWTTYLDGSVLQLAK